MRSLSICLIALVIVPLSARADGIVVNLGIAAGFAVLAGATVTNTGSSVVDGNLGLSPGTAVTGFPPGTVSGTIFAGDAVAMQAETDLTSAYDFAAGEACPTGNNLTGKNLGGLTLTPGVYCFSSSAQLTGTLTLNTEGNSNAVFDFEIGSTLTTASNSSIAFTSAGQSNNVFWQVGSSATLGTTTEFAGNILADTSITLNTGANIQCGSALAENGAVTMDSNDVSVCQTTTIGNAPGPGTTSNAPEPGTLWFTMSLLPFLITYVVLRSRGFGQGGRGILAAAMHFRA
jgi:hypothetical protein